MNKKSTLATVLIILAILVVGGGFSYVLLTTGPETVPKEKTSAAKIVQTLPLSPLSRSVSVSAFGSVIPSRQLTIKPQVSGEVIQQSNSLTMGGRLKRGEELIRIDAKDYELALAEVTSDLEQARFEREVESGRQVIAKREWDQLQSDLDMRDVNRSLVLREPHLRRAEALMQKAQNDIEKAELQLSRTVIRAPFNAMVIDESVEVGQLLNPSSDICELVGTDEFWIQVTLPFSQLKWIKFPDGNQPGADARILLDTGSAQPSEWNGRVIRLLSDLDPDGRMARLVLSVSDPLGLKDRSQRAIPLLLGSYVQVQINAGRLENALTIPRSALREGNSIWLVNAQNRLKVLPATVLWTEKETILIDNNVAPGDLLIVSDLRVALPDMEVVPQRSTAFPELIDTAPLENENES